LEKGFIDIPTNRAKRLIFKAAQPRSRTILALPRHELGSLVRAHRFAEKLVYRMQVYGQRIDPPAGRHLDPVNIMAEPGKSVDPVPDLDIIGMKDVGAVSVHHHTGLRVAFGVAIAGQMIAAFDDCDHMAGFGKLARDHRPGKTSPDNQHLHCEQASRWKTRLST